MSPLLFESDDNSSVDYRSKCGTTSFLEETRFEEEALTEALASQPHFSAKRLIYTWETWLEVPQTSKKRGLSRFLTTQQLLAFLGCSRLERQ
jgi:hypothetical protein